MPKAAAETASVISAASRSCWPQPCGPKPEQRDQGRHVERVSLFAAITSLLNHLIDNAFTEPSALASAIALSNRSP